MKFWWKAGIWLCMTAVVEAGIISVPGKESRTITRAMVQAKKGDTVLVAPGTYRERIVVQPGVTLLAKKLFEVVIDGGGRENVVTLAGDAVLSGVFIRNGTNGVFSKGMGNRIVQCRIARNLGTGIICVGHLPQIMDNEIVFNKSSGIQGWKVRSTVFPAIAHNTIAYNGNHGISIGGLSNLNIENNIIAYNVKFGIHIVGDTSKIVLQHNGFYNNNPVVMPVPEGNFQLKPHFVRPKRMDFSLAPDSPCRRKSPLGDDLGARLTENE